MSSSAAFAFNWPCRLRTRRVPEQTVVERECPDCAGCGQVASGDDRTPWKDWLALPLGSSLAVLLGVVRPLQCQRCAGTGKTYA